MVKIDLPDVYSRHDVDKARLKGQLIGWLQGGAVAVSGMLLLGVIGWIPTVAVIGVGGFAVYKLFAGPSKKE